MAETGCYVHIRQKQISVSTFTEMLKLIIEYKHETNIIMNVTLNIKKLL